MKKYLMGAAAAIAIAAPGVAAADSGQIGVNYANLDPSGGSSINVYGLNLAYSHDMSNGWTVQGDGASERFDSSGHVGQGYVGVSAGARNDQNSFYAFLGHGEILGGLDGFGGGIGGQIFCPNATVNGSLGYIDFDGLHATSADVNGAWFVNDNFAVNGDVSYTDFDFANVSTYGVGATWRFSGSPVALDVGYQKLAGDADGNVWRIGLTFNWGTDSAREQSQKGPSWDGARTLYHNALYFIF